MTAANEKPLPCPFCGTNAALDTPNYGRCQQIICMACGAEGPEIRHGCLSDAIAAWNRRAQTAEAVDEQLDYVLHIRKVRDGYVAITSPTLPGLLISGPDINECLADVPESVALLREANARARGGN